jgi:rod shape-determining protein MreC
MRNLLLFLWRHLNFIIFLLLEVFCIILMVSNNSFQRSSAISSANKLTGSVYSMVNTIEGYFNLRKTNILLAEENARLHSISPNAYAKYINQKVYVKDTVYKQQYEYVFANVVNNSVNRRNNYLTLDKGSLHGIKPEMAVITSSGIVGITKDVSPHFSSVLSVLNKDARISAKIKKNGFFGSLYWEGIDHRSGTLTDIPTHAGIKKGDTIVTNAYSAIFPDNIMIGVIESFSVKPGDNFYSIKVKYNTDFKSISQVYVIRNLLKEEQRKLEERSQSDK